MGAAASGWPSPERGTTERATALAQLFRVLGHPLRIRILDLLHDGGRTVGELQAELKLDSSGTSQHLAALRQHGVLDSRRVGTSVYYRIRTRVSHNVWPSPRSSSPPRYRTPRLCSAASPRTRFRGRGGGNQFSARGWACESVAPWRMEGEVEERLSIEGCSSPQFQVRV